MIALLLFACAQDAAEPVDLVSLYEAESDAAIDVRPLPTWQQAEHLPDGRENGDMAPAGPLPLVDGSGDFDLAELVGPDGTGDAAIVAFMASWCGPCEKSLPTLVELEARYGEDLTLVIYDIDVNAPGRRKMLERVREIGLKAPVVMAPTGVQRAWLGQGQSIPRMFFLNRAGEILIQNRGYDEGIAAGIPDQIAFTLAHPEYTPR